MKISLRPVNKQNYEAICDLEVTKQQEDYVAENTWSLVEAIFEGYESRAIYADEIVVGYMMWVQEHPHKIAIWRFMVDKEHQFKGVGRQALTLAISEIEHTQGLSTIEICYHPENPVAKSFYSSFGFKEIGMDEDNEDMLAIITL